MAKPRILLQLDPDPHASTFDSVVAIDAGAEHLLLHHGVTPDSAVPLVHGVIFTRAPQDLKNTAIFVGGTDVAAAEAVRDAVLKTFFGPMRVSVMLDANGANTTAAAAVLAAGKHFDLRGASALVLAATGPVGQRIVRLLARQGTKVRAASRRLDRAQTVVDRVTSIAPDSQVEAVQAVGDDDVAAALDGVQIVFATGAAGVELLSESARRGAAELKVAVDLNAVPPLGIAGVKVMDKAEVRDGVVCFGAIGVGGTKMKIHKAAIQSLFETNERSLDAEELFAIGQSLT